MSDSGRLATAARRRPWVVTLLVGCVLVLVVNAARGAAVTRDVATGPWRQRADADERRFACVAATVDELVPEGADVHVPLEPGPELEIKVAIARVFDRARVVGPGEPGALTLTLAEDPAGGGCDGVVLTLGGPG